MTKIDDRESHLAELLALFTDQMVRNPRPRLAQEFLASHPDYAEELKPLLNTVVALKSAPEIPRLNHATSDNLFTRISKGLGEARVARPGIVLERRPDFLILLLYLMKKIWNQDIWGRTKLVKLLFLLGKEAGCDQVIQDFYDHYAYSYGAFDKNVPKDADKLSRKGIIKMSVTQKPEMKAKETAPVKTQVNAMYRLTPKGKKLASALIKSASEIDPEILRKMEKVIREHGKKTTDELLSFTYKKYPETAVHSKVKDQYQ